MKTIETLLTHQNPVIRQLSKGLLKLGYQNIEMTEALGHRNGKEEYYYFMIADIEFRVWKNEIVQCDWMGVWWREMVTHHQSQWIEGLAEVNDLLRKVVERKEGNENY